MSIIFIELSFRLALGRAHTHEPTLSRIRAPVDSETAIVVNGSKAREREEDECAARLGEQLLSFLFMIFLIYL